GREAPELESLWSAIVEVAAIATLENSQRRRVRYGLLGQEDALGRIDVFVVAAGMRSSIRRGVKFARLDDPFDEFDHVLCTADDNPGFIAKLLLMDALEDKVPDLPASSIPHAVRQGV